MSSIRFSLLASASLVIFGIAGCAATKPATTQSESASAATTTAPIATPAVPSASKPAELFRRATFASLPGWQKDDLREAWPALLASCEVLVRKADWKEPCSVARDVVPTNAKAVRMFFESFFAPFQVINPDGTDT